jgi:general secretion pathway protein G
MTKGFTLIELVITLAILALLATIAAPVLQLNAKRMKEEQLRRALWEIRDGIDAYKQASDEGKIARKAGSSGYPSSLVELVRGVERVQSSANSKSKIYFLRQIPRDPFSPDSEVAAEDTWGKRNYESSHESPEEGEDVFDVYSLSRGKGLNGVPYKEW